MTTDVERLVMPLQPVYKDEHGTLRFKENAIVRYLLDNGGIDMNRLAVLNFNQADREQFASLIGYSLGGFDELSYVSDEASMTAKGMANGETECEARNAALREQLEGIRKGLKEAVPHAFRIHPDDLEA
ncbi:MAG: hypothetical protein KDI07_05195 [Anaerolineae bacterium]|nr:hypothetical protein [Anaerolineae bacterium]MCB1870324.1 hypothetical protein [Gammaproteobacteria bacterium]